MLIFVVVLVIVVRRPVRWRFMLRDNFKPRISAGITIIIVVIKARKRRMKSIGYWEEEDLR
jgi:hypothetical protein